MTETASHPALRAAGQIGLGAFLATAGTGHLTFQRSEFQAQVPSWIPLDADLVVLASVWPRSASGSRSSPRGASRRGRSSAPRPRPPSSWPCSRATSPSTTGHRDAFGLDSDTKRAVRLVFQPVLMAWALAATDALGERRRRRLRRA